MLQIYHLVTARQWHNPGSYSGLPIHVYFHLVTPIESYTPLHIVTGIPGTDG